MDDYDFEGKTVILRVDINSPVLDGKIEVSDRAIAAAGTINELSEKNAKVVVLAHQGRKGRDDFTDLSQHAEILSRLVGKEVEFVDDIIGEKAILEINDVDEGEILLLDNVRQLDEETMEKTPEEHSESKLVQRISPLADVYVNDAFSAAHRSHASLVGFIPVLPSLIGRTMQDEIESLEDILNDMNVSKHDTFVLSGAKPKDPLEIMEHMLEEGTLEDVLVGGIVGELFLIVTGHDLGKPTEDFLEKKGYLKFLPHAEKIWNNYSERIEIPVDLALDFNGKRKEILVKDLPSDHKIMDIGSETIGMYSDKIKTSRNIVMKGPVGVYENDEFGKGTEMLLMAVRDSEGHSLVGGGHTLSSLKKFGIEKSEFTHVSLAGGALIRYLSGKKMPVLEAFRNYT